MHLHIEKVRRPKQKNSQNDEWFISKLFDTNLTSMQGMI